MQHQNCLLTITTVLTNKIMSSIIWNPSPPIVITNPDLVKYLIFQLLAEAMLVCTILGLSVILIREEWYYQSKVWERERKRKE